MSNSPSFSAEAAHQRAKDRESMFLLASVVFEGETDQVSARVRNISPGGMMIDSHELFPKGHRLVAELKGIGKVRGVVAWATSTRMGIAFDREVDPKLTRQQVGMSAPIPEYATPVAGRRPGLGIR